MHDTHAHAHTRTHTHTHAHTHTHTHAHTHTHTFVTLCLVQEKCGNSRLDTSGVSDPIYRLAYFVQSLWRNLQGSGMDKAFRHLLFGFLFLKVGAALMGWWGRLCCCAGCFLKERESVCELVSGYVSL